MALEAEIVDLRLPRSHRGRGRGRRRGRRFASPTWPMRSPGSRRVPGRWSNTPVRRGSRGGRPMRVSPRIATRSRRCCGPSVSPVTGPARSGSWAITNHATVRAKSAAIRANVLEGLMPPWHADPAHGKFENDFSLTPQQQARLVAWLDAGARGSRVPIPWRRCPPSVCGRWVSRMSFSRSLRRRSRPPARCRMPM
jgi:hypothetical protein